LIRQTGLWPMLAQSGTFSNQKPWGPKTLALPQPALDFHWHISPISCIFIYK